MSIIVENTHRSVCMNEKIVWENRRMMDLLSRFISENPAAITPEMLSEITDCGISEEEAYAILMAEICGVDSYGEREFFNAYFRSMPRALNPEEYLNNPYRKNIPIEAAAAGKCMLSYLTYEPCEAFVCGDIVMDKDGREHVPVGYFRDGFTYPALTREGRVWMTITPLEIETMKPHIERAKGNIAVMGLGMGYYAYMASLKDDVTSITIVDMDDEVISLFKEHILPHFPGDKPIKIIKGDAFEFVEKCVPGGNFDYVFSDLWHDAADGMEMYLKLKKLEKLSPGTDFSYWIEETLKCYLKNI